MHSPEMLTCCSMSQLQLQSVWVTLHGQTRTFRACPTSGYGLSSFYVMLFPRTLARTWQLKSFQEIFLCKSRNGYEKGSRTSFSLCPISTGLFYYYFISPFRIPFSNPYVSLNSINTTNRMLNVRLGSELVSFLLFVYLSKVDTQTNPKVGLIYKHTKIIRLGIR